MQYTRLYADEHGDSHFEDIGIQLQPVNYAPPAPPLNLSALEPADKYGFVQAAAGWYGDWHASPLPQLRVIIAGEAEDEASDGNVRRHGAGSMLLMDDTFGKGHRTRALSELSIVVVQLPEHPLR